MSEMGHDPIGLEVIDELGVARIAERLDITHTAVRKWRQTGIPDNRVEALRNMVAEGRNLVAIGETLGDEEILGPPEKHYGAYPKNTDCIISHPDARLKAKLALAARRAVQARRHATQAAIEAGGLPPILPVRGYQARLVGLFALDFPILTMAFVAVTQVSPVVAAGSAVALSLFLVLGAHLLGGHLRELTRHTPAWLPPFFGAMVIGVLMACTIAITIDLRFKGFEIDALVAGLGEGGSIFAGAGSETLILPIPTQWAIVRAAALVTIMSTVFGIGWSYQRHAPQTTFALAEAAYARSVKAYADAVHRMRCKGKVAAFVLASTAILSLPSAAEAHQCEGAHVVAFVDTTTTYDDHDRDVIMRAIDQMAESFRPGQHVIMRTLRGHPDTSRILMDDCVPNDTSFEWSISGAIAWLFSNPAEVRTARQQFFANAREALLPQLQSPGDADKTALVATLATHTNTVGAIDAIWLFSDLLESDMVPAEMLISENKSLSSLITMLPSFQGVTVHVAGIGRFHDEGRQTLTTLERGRLVDSWDDLISGAGGRLDVFN